MVGLVFRDTLVLSPVQLIVLVENMLLCLLAFRYGWSLYRVLFGYLLNLSIAFYSTKLCIDVRMTWNQLYLLQGLSARQFLEILPYCNYIKFQSPVFPYFVSQLPSYVWQQCYAITWTGLCLCLCDSLYGYRHMLLISATPVVQLMATQPMNDLYAFGLILIALRCIQLRYRGVAAIIVLCACMTKYTVLVVFPVLLPAFGLFNVVVFVGLGLYIWWSSHWYWGQLHGRFLLHQFSLGLYSMFQKRPQSARPSSRWMKVFYTVRWRWRTVAHQTVLALPLYLFPLYTARWQWSAYCLLVGILCGYGNIKYLILVIPFCFPVQKT